MTFSCNPAFSYPVVVPLSYAADGVARVGIDLYRAVKGGDFKGTQESCEFSPLISLTGTGKWFGYIAVDVSDDSYVKIGSGVHCSRAWKMIFLNG